MQAFGGRAIGQKHLMPVQQKMVIHHGAGLCVGGNPRQPDQILGGNQHLWLSEQQFAIGTADQQQMLARDP